MLAAFKKLRRHFAALLVFGGIGLSTARAVIVDLDAFILDPALGCDGSTPLADGSWVYIIGSSDNVIDPMQTYNDGYIANSTTGDDVILGIVQIFSIPAAYPAYQSIFYETVQYDSSVISNVYVRFFDATGPLTGLLCWGESDIFELGITAGVSTVRFDQDNQLVTTHTNNFYIIPEPGTANLLLLVGGMILAMKASIIRKKKGEEAAPSDSDQT
ncbi:MAG: hypothetical protein M9963_10060 [Kiritimatiellae bacterium]|nr:hypothetical protein [Kiritimatiellia bacterium]MCO5067167.1 hypothetical protein [Kiritimatiellia bacterium]MCO6399654.1 hypothetical protein [Verrucomicrobiota bacterium]